MCKRIRILTMILAIVFVMGNLSMASYVSADALKVAAPVATPGAGAVAEGTSVTLTCETVDAKIFYTLNGNTPTRNSNRYSGPITINRARTLKAIAIKSGMTNSDVFTADYTLLPKEKVSAPTASPQPGAVASGTQITLLTATTGATIYYTLNGNTPTTNSNRYSGPITINRARTLKAIAVKSGMTNSDVFTGDYTLLQGTVSPPIASPAPGTVNAGTPVSLSTQTSGAVIYFTVDGSTPTTSSTIYSPPILINATTTIKAFAVKSGMNNSPMLTATYSVVTPPVIAVTGVTLDKSSLSLIVGTSATLQAAIQPANATNQNILWSSSNSSVATVANGLVSAVSQGSATITVTTVDGSKTAACTVTVFPGIRSIVDVQPLKDLAVAQGTAAASIGLPQMTKAVLNDNTTLDIPVSWDTTTYNKDVLGTYTLSGNLTALPEYITNPNSKTASIKVTVIIPNMDPNPNTTLTTSMGTTLLELDSLSELNASTSAKVELEQGNVVSGTASARITSLAPIPAGGTESYISVQTSGTIGDKLKDISNIEFNLYIPDKLQVDYILVNFYTNTWHSTFYQADIGTWELTPGWNKIRKSKEDIRWIDSTIAAANASAVVSASAKTTSGKSASISSWDVSQKITDHKNKVNQFNNLFISKMNSSHKQAGTADIAAALADTGTSYWNTVDNMEFFIAFKTGSTPSITLDRVSYNFSGKAKILFTFDDAWYDVLKYGYPILRDEGKRVTGQEEGFKATLWANMQDSQANNANRNPSQESMWILNESELGQMYVKGWDIGNHTVSHPDNIATLPDSELIYQYKTNLDWIKNSGWTRASDHVCYPSGQFDERLIQILQGLGAKTGRTTVFGTQPAPVFNIFKLKCIYIGRDSVFNDPNNPNDPNKPYWIKSEIDRAVATGSTLFIMLHRVESDTADLSDPEYGPLAVRESNFRQIVQYVAGLVQQNAIEVDTISQWYDAYMQ